MIRTTNELLELLNARMGDSATDEDLQFVEDFVDTVTELSASESRIMELEQENEELRKKYRDRFFATTADEVAEKQDEEIKTTFESLFEEVEE